MSKLSTGILIHGCNLGAFQWQRIIWGKPPYELGRVTRALLLLLEEHYDLKTHVNVLVIGTSVVWNGSGTRKERSGVIEAEEICKLMFEKLPQLKEFEIFRQRFPAVSDETFIEKLRAQLEEITALAMDSQNTAEEIRNAIDIFQKANVNRAFIVSSPVHLPRCIKEACIALGRHEMHALRHALFAVASDTNYQNTTPSDVAIFEPPHRPDRPMYPIQQLVRRIAKVPHDKMEFFLKDLDELLEEYQA